MNKQIQELALEAGYLPDEFGIGHWDMPECKKFAELMIEEVRSVLSDVYREVPLECAGHFLHADEVIMKHFYGKY